MATLEKEYMDGDQYSVLTAIYFCGWLGCEFPDWIRFELLAVAGLLIEVDPELTGQGRNYQKYVCDTLRLSGSKRRTKEVSIRNASIATKCREEIKNGKRRMDIVNKLSENENHPLNLRDVEKIYDLIKNTKLDINELNIQGNQVKALSRKSLLFDEATSKCPTFKE